MADSLTLKPHPRLQKPKGPVVVVVLDGVGIGPGDKWDAVAQASMPHLKGLIADKQRSMQLNAHGTGRIVLQGASLVDSALETGSIFEGAGWKKMQAQWQSGGTFHIIGLL